MTEMPCAIVTVYLCGQETNASSELAGGIDVLVGGRDKIARRGC